MTRFPFPVLVTTTFLAEGVVFTVWFPKLRGLGFSEAAGVPIAKPTVDQLLLELPEALIQFAVAVFKIVPVATLESLTTIVIVSISLVAMAPNVTVTPLLPLWQTPLGLLEQVVDLAMDPDCQPRSLGL